ncbi:MAG: 3-dehydroquinate synthase, partial [Limnochordales bacterium]
ALGGGVVGDLAGFAAATFLRGVALIQVPTTLLAQVDAAVGGKVGVNLDEGKNLVGAFHQPRIVIADVDTLRTLPKRQLAAGLAEVIKYGVIGDPDLLQFVEDRLDRLAAGDRAALLRIVARSCEIKAAVVAEDERETEGVRECLNFGHTIGHALEAAFGYEGMLHGEAVAAGMVAAAMLSARLTGFPEAEVQRLADLLQRAGLPAAPPPVEEAKLLTLIRRDKKTVDQKIRFVLAEQPGRWVVRDDVPDDLVLEIVREQRNRWASAK